MNSIFDRKSIRKFKEKKVGEEEIRLLLRAGMSAPTACNQREWEFVVVTDEGVLGELAGTSPYAKPAEHVPLSIVPLGNCGAMSHPKFFEQDLGAACENILVEAVELGLGAVWMGVAPDQERMGQVSRILKLPEHVKPFAILAVGYPDEIREAEDRYDETKVHYNRY